ncbi:MAG: RNA polymerase sigma-70 factor [Balneolaceae bacterium]|jgi:RNA polymerase sigma-70 factor (family 1)|nr:RNA polymerase sigma-70 factor [Balneolaceae bacterium]
MSEILGENNRKLTVDLRKGCPNAFRKIFEKYHQKLVLYSLAIVKQDHVAKDIVQDTFIRLWTNRGKIDPDQSLSGYLHTITRNLALNHLKRAGYDHELKNRIWKTIQESQHRVSTEESLIAMESSLLIQEAIDRLPPQRQRIYLLSREKGMSHQEIGLKLGISKNTVKNQIVTALKELRSHLEKYTDIALIWFIAVLAYWL